MRYIRGLCQQVQVGQKLKVGRYHGVLHGWEMLVRNKNADRCKNVSPDDVHGGEADKKKTPVRCIANRVHRAEVMTEGVIYMVAGK